jgi:hypothetical protein
MEDKGDSSFWKSEIFWLRWLDKDSGDLPVVRQYQFNQAAWRK